MNCKSAPKVSVDVHVPPDGLTVLIKGLTTATEHLKTLGLFLLLKNKISAMAFSVVPKEGV